MLCFGLKHVLHRYGSICYVGKYMAVGAMPADPNHYRSGLGAQAMLFWRLHVEEAVQPITCDVYTIHTWSNLHAVPWVSQRAIFCVITAVAAVAHSAISRLPEEAPALCNRFCRNARSFDGPGPFAWSCMVWTGSSNRSERKRHMSQRGHA